MNNIVIETIETHRRLVAEFEKKHIGTVVNAAAMIVDCFGAGGCVYLCGNGGSAADAQHLAGEFVGRFRRNRRALPAVALTADSSVVTCTGNDFGFDDVFARQVEALVGGSDILWAFSTSGTSSNVVAAAKAAKAKGAKVLSFTGKCGTVLEELSDICLGIESPNTAAAQEIHMLAYHIICDLVDTSMFGDETV